MRFKLVCTLAVGMSLAAFTMAQDHLARKPIAVSIERVVVGSRTTEGIPPLSAELGERMARYQNTRGASFAGWLNDGAVLITTRFGETEQVHRVTQPLGMREQLTFFSEPLMAAQAVPVAAPGGFVFGKDVGGSEFWQLYHFNLATREIERLTDGKRSRNERAVLARDGRSLAYSSTARNGSDGDIWVRNFAEGEPRLLASPGGTWHPLDFSPDGKRVLVAQYVSIEDVRPGVIDIASGKLERFPVAGGKAGFGTFKFAPDGRAVYYISDEESEFKTLRHHDPVTGTAPTLLTRDIPWDIQDFRIAADGRHLAFASNEDGIGKLTVLSLPNHKRVALPELPLGVIGNFAFSPDGLRLAINTDAYRRDLRRAEYGDERDPAMAAYFARIAPLARASEIGKPLFVAQGANDPRVPASEAAQIVKAVRANGTEVWYLEQSDEGHGFRKKANRDYFATATMAFWMRHLVQPWVTRE